MDSNKYIVLIASYIEIISSTILDIVLNDSINIDIVFSVILCNMVTVSLLLGLGGIGNGFAYSFGLVVLILLTTLANNVYFVCNSDVVREL